ncbi:DUF3515 family protein [Microbacterium sp. GXF7504]
MIRTRSARLLAVLVAAAAGLTGCAGTVSLQAAPEANDPACARVTAYLPDRLAGQERRWTDAQATGAWGDPAAILLTCGVEAPAASELLCQSVEGIDWLVDDSDSPRVRFTTFGRQPAVEVYVDYDAVASYDVRNVLAGLAPLVGTLPRTAECTERPAA